MQMLRELLNNQILYSIISFIITCTFYQSISRYYLCSNSSSLLFASGKAEVFLNFSKIKLVLLFLALRLLINGISHTPIHNNTTAMILNWPWETKNVYYTDKNFEN